MIEKLKTISRCDKCGKEFIDDIEIVRVICPYCDYFETTTKEKPIKYGWDSERKAHHSKAMKQYWKNKKR